MSLYDVFISYSRKDVNEVENLIGRLRHDIPKIRLWYDIEGIESADAFKHKIINAINQSDVVIFACSDNSLSSEYCEKEVTYAKNIGKKVVPFLLPGCELKDWLLFDFGNINCIHSTKDDEVVRMIEDLKNWKQISENEPVKPSLTSKDSRILSNQNIQTSQPRAYSSTKISSGNEDRNYSSKEAVSSSEKDSHLVTPTSFQPSTYISLNQESFSSASCENETVTSIEPPIGMIKGHTYVDLGLTSGVKWATCNVGANTPEEYGDYFAWGDLVVRQSYDTPNCVTFKKDIDWLWSHGFVGARKQLEMSHDVARQRWGGTWRMPSRKEIEELIKECDWNWTTLNCVNGYRVQSKKNGNSIFIPAAGYRERNKRFGLGEKGYLWSSSANEGAYEISYCLAFSGHKVFLGMYNRYLGFSIRPVTD